MINLSSNSFGHKSSHVQTHFSNKSLLAALSYVLIKSSPPIALFYQYAVPLLNQPIKVLFVMRCFLMFNSQFFKSVDESLLNETCLLFPLAVF